MEATAPMTQYQHLRPLERAVLRRLDEGMTVQEIAVKFKRGPDHIDRVISYAKIPDRTGVTSDVRDGLRPLERRILYWRGRGLSHHQIGTMFRRSAAHIRRIEGLAHLRKGIGILRG
jgi:DNA-binding CsgD family transcriptional regulator